MNVIIGTRGSKLALAQAEYVKNRLQKHYPQNSYELKIISTKGDREQKKALDQMGDKGLFVREIEQELLDGTISLAVHSMKDMPAEQPSGLVFARFIPIRFSITIFFSSIHPFAAAAFTMEYSPLTL